MAGEIGEQQSGKEDEPREHEDDEHDVRDRGDRVERVGQPIDVWLVRADGDDPGRHDDREVAGEQRRNGVRAVLDRPCRNRRRHGRRNRRRIAAQTATTTETAAVAHPSGSLSVWNASTATVMRNTWKA